MPKPQNESDLPEEDLEVLSTAQADWDGVGDASEEEALLEDALGVESEEEDDVIGEDDDNPYQESDEALPDDDEERDIAQLLRRE